MGLRSTFGNRVLWAIVCMVAALSGVMHAATPADVDASLRRAKDYLYSQQKEGNWERAPARDPTARPHEETGGQWGGVTALATYALLAAGESHEDPRLKQAIEFLTKADIIGTYALSMRANVWNLLPKSAEIKQAMYKDMRLIRAAVKSGGPARGLYDYVDTGPAGSRFDHSVSQYGVLGAWACAENIEGIGPEYWKMVDEAWRRDQLESGAWCYQQKPSARHPETIGMTAAGVATLFVTQDFLTRGRGLEPSGNIRDEDIERGIKWISDNYQRLYADDKTQSHHPYYSFYGVERIGLASGYKYLGGVNWYDDGASFLLKRQGKDGNWSNAVDTSFCVLFLARGRSPIILNKLEYEVGLGDKARKGNWNQRPRDVANLARFIGRQIERNLNWQIVNLGASVSELHDAPILYISGNQNLLLSDEQRAKLQQFVEEGGLIVAHADAGSREFANSIRKLGPELFKYEFRALPAAHPIYTSQQFSAAKWRRKQNVLGLSNGVRELVLLLPDGDPARYWQSYDVASRTETFELMANVVQYAVDKQNLRNRGETHLVSIDPAKKPTRTIKLARVKHDGNWDPEPGGWRRLKAIMHNAALTELSVETCDIRQLASSGAPVAHMTGTAALKFDQPSRDSLRQYVEQGGMLIVDAAGGSTEFAQAIETELGEIFADSAAALREPLPEGDPFYQRGGKLEIEYRTFTRQALSGDLRSGRIRMMKLKNKPAVVYSPEDLSAGLVGQPCDGIVGYSPKTATELMMRILMLSSAK